MENRQRNFNAQNETFKTKTPIRIQVIKFAIGLVIGVSIYLIVKLIF